MRVEQTVDVALRKLPAGANAPQSLPKAFRGRCQPQKPKQILMTSLVPNGRCGDFEPEFEIHRVAAASMINVKQLRRIQSLLRKLAKGQAEVKLLPEWRKILRFVFQGADFVSYRNSVQFPGTCHPFPGFMI